MSYFAKIETNTKCQITSDNVCVCVADSPYSVNVCLSKKSLLHLFQFVSISFMYQQIKALFLHCGS